MPRRPDVNVTTDVIVGFPTEDEAAFERTLSAVDAAGISRVHTFLTRRAPEPSPLRSATASRRPRRSAAPRSCERARRSARGIHRSTKLGRIETVLVDKVADTQCSGYTADYTRCYLPAGVAARGELVRARCVELQADGTRCEIQ